MAKKSKVKRKQKTPAKAKAKPAAAPKPEVDNRSPAPSARTIAIGFILLGVCIALAFVLVWEHFGWRPPGCGIESNCHRAANSYWGKVPCTDWPTSFLGLAYFLGLLAAWILSIRGVGIGLRWIVRLGVLGSIWFIGVMFVGGYICAYCFSLHVANMVFLILIEMNRTAKGRSIPALGALAVVFIITNAALLPIESQHKAAVKAEAEKGLSETITELTDPTTPEKATEAVAQTEREPFTGRYRIGPEEAAIRIVMFTDYQCSDCQKIDPQVFRLLDERDDISLSVKHFPMNNLCNKHMRGMNPHGNACWAARAAEAAGKLHGEDGFWRMHRWLFENKGSFTDRSFPGQLRALGFDPQQFIPVMSSRETLNLVQADIEEAISYGIYFTPMVFINGVELKGFTASNAVIRAVEALSATNPPTANGATDWPPAAIEKYIADWREERARSLPDDDNDWSSGPADAETTIVIWGDYQESGTAELDMRVRAAIDGRDDVRYSFRHFPVNKQCNSHAWDTLHPLACRMAQAAEASGRLGGVEAYWKMHSWLFENRESFSDTSLRAAATDIGLDADALFAEMTSVEVAIAITEDGLDANTSGLRGVPFFFVDGKRVPRWRLEGQPVPERIIEEALADGPTE